MATRLIPLFYQILDANGDPANGWKLYFYETGTTTPKDTYSDTALTVANTNPVVADINGRFGNIYGATKDDYKVILKNANDNTISTNDPIDTVTYNINSFNTRPAQHWGTTTGTADAYQIKPIPSITAYSDDLLFSVQAHLNCNAGCTLAVFQEGTASTYLTAQTLKKYNGAGAKIDLEASDMLANQTYLIRHDGTNPVVLNPEKPYFDWVNITEQATTSSTGVNFVDKYWKWGFIPSGNSGTPDEQVDVTAGKCIAKDGSTILELTSDATGIDFVTLNGGALSNDASYHLFRYLKDDDTMQWHLDTSLTPTISDIKSANAYRLVYRALTDASGDLPNVTGYDVGGGSIKIELVGTMVNVYNGNGTGFTVSRAKLPQFLPDNNNDIEPICPISEAGQSGNIYILFTNDLMTDTAPTITNCDLATQFVGAVGYSQTLLRRMVANTDGTLFLRLNSTLSIPLVVNFAGFVDYLKHY